MRSLFINNKSEIRSGFKIILFFFFYFLITLISFPMLLTIVALIMAEGNFNIFGQYYTEAQNYLLSSQIDIVWMIISKSFDLASILVIIFIFLKLSNKKFKEIGLVSIKENYRKFLWGSAIGAASMTVIFFCLLISNNATLENSLLQPNFTINVFWGIILYIVVSLSEEIMCRGYIQTTLYQMRMPYLAAVISSTIFAFLHLGNPNVKILGIVNIFFIGLLLSYMYIRTKNLWMPIGYHFTWNYFQGNIYGFPVSGTTQSIGIYNIDTIKENIITGGSFGPEAGILATIVISISFVIIKGFTKK
ncbi:CAAX amino terminal protease self- immunity [Clostridium homopropionicum DSM 5847]|uniref:CAAX amino terminal protease self-immunity n=1 Tax=Clostridium homopropionicum DSM 5847 TaxID=1121318 RepID=A0A0L6Z878_9CLOT|nr:CPBP family intramembrane glutamic endopeptidase [Clostridium homopropionicum]KOA19013.1 CAAX amino terminal protease self- immunity [Clostridium homopropionicum DSM 5847]SFH00893.1 hypothetical protein SAMN04488501_13416 [Clostridium homopropionicum]